MTHLIAVSKSVTTAQSAGLYMRQIARLHRTPPILYSDRGPQCTTEFWKELWEMFETRLRYSIAYYPQAKGIVEQMNTVVGKVLRCTLAQMNDVQNWLEVLPTIEVAIKYLPNRSTGYSPFFLNYVYCPIIPADFLCGKE